MPNSGAAFSPGELVCWSIAFYTFFVWGVYWMTAVCSHHYPGRWWLREQCAVIAFLVVGTTIKSIRDPDRGTLLVAGFVMLCVACLIAIIIHGYRNLRRTANAAPSAA